MKLCDCGNRATFGRYCAGCKEAAEWARQERMIERWEEDQYEKHKMEEQ